MIVISLQVAQECGFHNTVGIDLVAMSVNDILAQGAEPLFFLDYFASGKLSTEVVKHVVTGVAQGCALAGCALLGGMGPRLLSFYSMSCFSSCCFFLLRFLPFLLILSLSFQLLCLYFFMVTYWPLCVHLF